MKYLKLLVLVLAIAVAFIFRESGIALVKTASGALITKADPNAKARPQPQAVPAVIAPVVQKTMPVEFRSVGTVQTESSVVVKVRVESVVERVLVADGAPVKTGDILVELDKRQIDAQIEQINAAIRRDEAQIEQAHRNDTRSNDLAQRGITARVTADDARTAASVAEANRAADLANLKALQLQRQFHTITAPIDGQVGVVNVRPGAFVRNADANSIIATINQIDPIYVAIAVPQDLLAQISLARSEGTARIELMPPGTARPISGPVTMIDNTVDATTGLLTVRARLPNPQALVWPGQIADARLIIRNEPAAIVVPNEAVQTSQAGNFVFVVGEDKKARVRPIKVARTVGSETVIASGLKPGEMVIVDGQLRVTEGATIAVSTPARPRTPSSSESATE